MKQIQEYLMQFGYSEKDIEPIVTNYILLLFKEETLLNNIKNIQNYLDLLGYTKQDVIKMTKTFPAIMVYL